MLIATMFVVASTLAPAPDEPNWLPHGLNVSCPLCNVQEMQTLATGLMPKMPDNVTIRVYSLPLNSVREFKMACRDEPVATAVADRPPLCDQVEVLSSTLLQGRDRQTFDILHDYYRKNGNTLASRAQFSVHDLPLFDTAPASVFEVARSMTLQTAYAQLAVNALLERTPALELLSNSGISFAGNCKQARTILTLQTVDDGTLDFEWDPCGLHARLIVDSARTVGGQVVPAQVKPYETPVAWYPIGPNGSADDLNAMTVHLIRLGWSVHAHGTRLIDYNRIPSGISEIRCEFPSPGQPLVCDLETP